MALGDSIGELKKLIVARPDLFGENVNQTQIWGILEKEYPEFFQRIRNEIELEGPRDFERDAINRELETIVRQRDYDKKMQSERDLIEKKRIEEEKNLKARNEQDALIQKEVARRTQADLAKTLDDIYSGIETSGIDSLNREYGRARSKLIDEEAALGRLKSPASIVPLSRIDEQKSNAIASLLSSIGNQKAAQKTSLTQTLEQMLQSRDLANLDDLFRNKQLGETVRQYDTNLSYQREQDKKSDFLRDQALLREDALRRQQREDAELSLWDKIDRGLSTTKSFINVGSDALKLGRSMGGGGGEGTGNPVTAGVGGTGSSSNLAGLSTLMKLFGGG